MPTPTDWRRAIRHRADLAGIDLPDSTIDEIATHLHDIHAAAVRSGLDEDAASAKALEALDNAVFDDLQRHAARHLGGLRPARVLARLSGALEVEGIGPARGTVRDAIVVALREIVLAVRQLGARPLFSATAIATLAVGIGATTGIFSAVNAAMIRSLPYPDQTQLYALGTFLTDGRYSTGLLAPMEVTRVNQGAASVVAAVFVGPSENVIQTPDGGSLQTVTCVVSEGFFDMLGAPLSLGRGFTADEHLPNAPLVAVLSYRLWDERFLRSPDVLGTPLSLTSGTATIVGVAAPDVDLPQDTAIWLNARVNAESTGRAFNGYLRARPGTTRERLDAELSAVMAGIAIENALIGTGRTYTTMPLVDSIIGDLGPILIVVLTGAAVLLLLGCVNVANLLLARSATRSREIAIRAALGASRGRLVLHLLAEAFVLSTAGAIGGLCLAWAGLQILQTVGASDLPRLSAVPLDGRVLAVAGLTLIGTTLLIGLVPSVRLAATDVRTLLGSGNRSVTGGRGAARLRTGMVVAEIALAIALVSGAGWVVRGFSNLASNDPGFDPNHRLVFDVLLSNRDFPEQDAARVWYDELKRRVAAVPGVRAVASSVSFPLRPDREGFTYLNLVGNVYDTANPMSGRVRRASHNFFADLGVPVLAGRTFSEEEGLTRSTPDEGGGVIERLAIVNRSFMDRYLQDRDPLRTRLVLGTPTPNTGIVYTIVGVVENVRYVSLGQAAEPTIYTPENQAGFPYRQAVLVSTFGDPSSLIASVRQEVQAFDPRLPADVHVVSDMVTASLGRQRLGLLLMSLFAVAAVALAAIGIYGVIAFSTSERLREVATRLALGASPSQVFWMMMRQGRTLGLVGVVAGVASALALGRVVAWRLYDVRIMDPSVLVAAVLVVGVTTLVATAVPAWRAARVDPSSQMRAD